jgi:23S rRNA (uracil1939-C5)-methyltransferase
VLRIAYYYAKRNTQYFYSEVMHMRNEVFEIVISTLTFGGEGMGRLPTGQAVFVPFVLPGEKVRIRILNEKRNFARAELLDVLEPSSERITPKCKHFFTANQNDEWCGGCHYQHMSYEAQLRAKESILRDQLTRIGKIENPPVSPIVPSPDAWNYRNQLEFYLTDKGKLGLISLVNNILPIFECHQPEPAINDLWPQLEFEPDAPIDRINLRAGADGELMLVLESENPEPPEIEIEADISVAHLCEDDAVVLAGEDCLIVSVMGRPFRVSPGTYLRSNTRVAEKMIEHLIARLPLDTDAVVIDAYCGAGFFSAFIAPYVKRLIGIELSPAACEDFAANLDEFEGIELYEASVEDVLSGLDPRPEVILVDPPRTGLDRLALDGIVALESAVIAYISSDPSTLARDAARLIAAGYNLADVTPFDVSPQTAYIESISIFEK